MLDVDGARGLEYRWRYPQHFSVALYNGHRFAVFLQSTVRTAEHTHTRQVQPNTSSLILSKW